MLKRPDEMSEESERATIEREPGALVLWKWLSLERFFPPDREIWHATLRGVASVSDLLITRSCLHGSVCFNRLKGLPREL